MNPRRPLLALAAVLALLIQTPAQAAIVWADPGTIAYNAGSSVGLSATNAYAAGIGMDFSSNHDGTFDLGPGNRNICFTTTADIAAGTSIDLFFDFSHQLGSGGPASGFSPPPRAASKFRLANSTSVTVDTLMYGGNDTLQNYWGGAGGPLTSTLNPGVLEFQDVFMQDPGAPGGPFFGQGPTSAIFQGFSNPNTATITGGDSDPILSIDGDAINGNDITLFDIVDPGRNSIDLSFSGWRYTVTPNETLVAGSKFLFTFEGMIIGDRIGIPEPSRALLLAAGLIVFGLRRKR